MQKIRKEIEVPSDEGALTEDLVHHHLQDRFVANSASAIGIYIRDHVWISWPVRATFSLTVHVSGSQCSSSPGKHCWVERVERPQRTANDHLGQSI